MKNKLSISTTSIAAIFTLIILSLFSFSKGNTSQKNFYNGLPIGSIIIWAGEESPPGWQICRGQRKSKSGNTKLYEAIGGYWNKDVGDNADFFQLPDLRGVFIRGVNGSRDDMYKDEGPRKSITGKSVFNYTVGSFQNDNFQEHDHGGGDHKHSTGNHTHGLKVWDKNNVRYNKASAAYIGTTQRGTARTENSSVPVYNSGTIIKNNGGSETRPKNAYVHYIIKVR